MKYQKYRSKKIGLQILLPIFPADLTLINNLIGFQNKDGIVYYFNAMMPIFSHAEDDIASFRLITSQLYINGNCKQSEIIKAFGVSPISVKRYVKKYREEGPESFYVRPIQKRKPRVLIIDVINKAQELLDEGNSRKEVAEKLHLKVNTLAKAIKAGRLIQKKTKV